ncbi:peroxisome assembly protein 12-like isoform X1 [Tubulanus polymorphus]|uniref:peroxisome assembly protein 12-like isoform X1 n=1 Tax=Tubulanus polymorphus TaxID=672921 RepID=UPI003DA4A053
MAEFGAHITSSRSSVTSKPSIFEVLAQENLTAALRPAIKHVLKVLADKNPARFLNLYRFADEIHLFINIILEHVYLKKFGASFAEEFYSLRRETKLTQSQTQPSVLPTNTRIKSLIFLAVFPYLKMKCNNLYERLLYETQNLNQQIGNKSLHKKLCLAYVSVYPYIHSLFEASMFICQLLYIFGKLDYHSLFLPLAGVRLVWQKPKMNNEMDQVKHNETAVGLVKRMLSILSNCKDLLITLITNSLTTSVFFLQFLEWWYNSDKVHNIAALPIPPAPNKDEYLKDIPNTNCPLCHRTRTNDTALTVSGYVFCYPCIYKYVSSHHRCPVTNYPATAKSLIRLYKDGL